MIIKDKGIGIDLFNVIKLIHVPSVNRELVSRMEEWRNEQFKDIDREYQEKRKEFYRKMYSEPLEALRAAGEEEKYRLYWYELQHYQETEWRTVNFEPVTYYIHRYLILRSKIILEMAATKDRQGEIREMKGLQPMGNVCTIDLQYVFLSASHLLVAVKEHLTPYFKLMPMKGVVVEVESGSKDGPPNQFPEMPPGKPENVNLMELIRLSQIAEFSLLVNHNLREIENGPLAKEIEDFYELRDRLHRSMTNEHRDKHSHWCWFELTEFFPGDWGITHIDDTGMTGYLSHHSILPETLFPRLYSVPVDPDRVVTETMEIPAIEGGNAVVSWIKLSSNYIVGTVRGNLQG
jgi:hypothetical protein